MNVHLNVQNVMQRPQLSHIKGYTHAQCRTESFFTHNQLFLGNALNKNCHTREQSFYLQFNLQLGLDNKSTLVKVKESLWFWLSGSYYGFRVLMLHLYFKEVGAYVTHRGPKLEVNWLAVKRHGKSIIFHLLWAPKYAVLPSLSGELPLLRSWLVLVCVFMQRSICVILAVKENNYKT